MMKYLDLALQAVGAFALAAGLITTIARQLPAEVWARLHAIPRVDNVLRALRAGGLDVVKFLRAVAAVLTGTPWAAWVPVAEGLAGTIASLTGRAPTDVFAIRVGAQVQIEVGDRAALIAPEEAERLAGQLLEAAHSARTWSSALRGKTLPMGTPTPSSAPARASDQRGFARFTGLLVVVLIGLVAALASIVGCGPVRELVMRAAPGVPDPSSCTEGAYRCNGAVPEACSASGRFWPALARRADGSQRVCAGGCGLTDGGVAVCLAPDAGDAMEGGAR